MRMLNKNGLVSKLYDADSNSKSSIMRSSKKLMLNVSRKETDDDGIKSERKHKYYRNTAAGFLQLIDHEKRLPQDDDRDVQ